MSRHEKFYHLEEAFHSRGKKEHRKERQVAEKRDRSQYKKSDQDQLKKQPIQEICHPFLRGRVLAIVPEGVVVACNNAEYLCSLKGGLKQYHKRIKNLVAVGDFVRFETQGNNQGAISAIEERFSILSRADNLSRNKEQLIAVNIDQVLITCSILTPPLKPPLIDRYIIAAEKGNMRPVIVMNKIDLLPDSSEEKALYEELLPIYATLNIPVISVSATTGEGLERLAQAMYGKTSVFSGQSGTGKTSLINHIAGTALVTGSIVYKTGKGSQTTTTTHLIPLQEGGFCVDTPGIKSFGLWDLEPKDLAAYYSEINALSSQCRFPDCSHLNEPDCAVAQAVQENRISPLRFASYSALMSSLSEKHRRR